MDNLRQYYDQYGNIKYFQCKLVRNQEEIVSYIPYMYAKVGNVLRLKNMQDWSNGWIVSQVYDNPIEVNILDDLYRDWMDSNGTF